MISLRARSAVITACIVVTVAAAGCGKGPKAASGSDPIPTTDSTGKVYSSTAEATPAFPAPATTGSGGATTSTSTTP